jgi:hypothetical protein
MGTIGIVVFSLVMLHLVAGFGYVMYKLTVGDGSSKEHNA